MKKFITGDVVAHITECTNKRAKVFSFFSFFLFEENREFNGKIGLNRLKWRVFLADEFYVPQFYVFLALYAPLHLYRVVCFY